MNNFFLILLFSILHMSVIASDVSKDSGSASTAEKSDGSGKSEDDSVIVNKDGLNESGNRDEEFEKNKIYPPKEQQPMTLPNVAAKAKENNMQSVSIMAIYANSSALRNMPESVFQIAEQQLDNATKTDEQRVNFGPDLEGATQKEGVGVKDDDDKEGEDAQGTGDRGKDKETSTGEGSDSFAFKSKAKRFNKI